MVSEEKKESIVSVEDAINKLFSIKKDKLFTFSLFERGIPQKFPFGIWFRGQSDSGYDLEPGVFRKRLEKPERIDETNLIIHSSLRLPIKKKYEVTFDWLCYMQHYGSPTRILDWTENILTALFFAVKEHPEKDGELIVLNSRTLNKVTRGSSSICTPDSFDLIVRAEMARHRKKQKIKNAAINSRAAILEDIDASIDITRYNTPVAVFPNRWNERMLSQESVFTVHGGKFYYQKNKMKDELFHDSEYVDNENRMSKPESLMSINNKELKNGNPPFLKYYIIPKDKKTEIEETLFCIGVHEGSLFPELEKQTSYMEKIWNQKLR